ncbi:MAG: hypothetical protein ACKVT2_16615 [Saprospiraceae bacterium]
MNKYHLFAFFVLLTTLCCKKEKEPAEPPFTYWGEASFHVHGNILEASPFGLLLPSDTALAVVLHVFNPSGIRTGGLSFHNIPMRPGIYSLKKRIWSLPDDGMPFAAFHEVADDVGLGTYAPLENNNTSLLTITSFDKLSNEISGTFDVTLLIDSLDKVFMPTLLDTLRFTNGYFHTKVRKP